MSTRSLAKDFHRLQKNIASFSNSEARIVDFTDDLTRFDVELTIKDGYYKDALFLVQVSPENYPHQAPDVKFMTEIFHPNIDDGYDAETVCLNLLDEWLESNDLEDIVHGLLFLVKNPNFHDPLNPLFGFEYSTEGEDYIVNFASNVRKALEGGEVEGVTFKRNPGLGPQPGCKAVGEYSDMAHRDLDIYDEPKKECEVGEIPGTTVEKPSPANALVLSKIPDDLSPTISTLLGISMKAQLHNEMKSSMVYKDYISSTRLGEEKRLFLDESEQHSNWLVSLMTALKKYKFEKRTVNVRTICNPLRNVKPITYLQRALK